MILVGLYLRGAPSGARPSRRRAAELVRRLRAEPGEDPAKILREAGLRMEAAALETPGLLEWSRRHAHEAVSLVHPRYPGRWRERLADAAPAAAWVRANRAAPDEPRPLIGVVGSRVIAPGVARFAEGVGRELARLGYDLVFGGAAGCDNWALAGASAAGRRGLCLTPLGLRRHPPTGDLDLTLSPPDSDFTAGAAMERNPLIFAAAEATVVVHARYRAGGGWQGATEALRRRLGPVIVRDDPDSEAHRALIALGALPLASPDRLADAIAAASSRFQSLSAGLFSCG